MMHSNERMPEIDKEDLGEGLQTPQNEQALAELQELRDISQSTQEYEEAEKIQDLKQDLEK